MTAKCGTTADDSTSAHPVMLTRDAAQTAQFSDGDNLGTASIDVAGDERCGASTEDTVDRAATAGRLTNKTRQSGAAVACEPVVVGDDAQSASSASNSSVHVDDTANDSDSVAEVVDQPTSSQLLLDRSSVDPSVTSSAAISDVPTGLSSNAASGADSSRSSVATCDHDQTSARSRSSCPPPPLASSTSAARHALPSAVAAPSARGKHRLPPVLTHEKTTSVGQAHGGLERISPLSLVGPHLTADSTRAATSLTGGTRLGDLGLSQPPMNLSVADQAVNMKVVSITSQRSTVDTGSRAGM